MSEHKSCYIAGPMTGYADLNYPAFAEASRILRERGFGVVSPAELNPIETAYEDAMRNDIRALIDCNHICMLEGWEKSKGATLEHHIATVMGLTIITLTQPTASASAPTQSVPDAFAPDTEIPEAKGSTHLIVALEKIADFNDTSASLFLEKYGNYSRFAEPDSVKIARETLWMYENEKAHASTEVPEATATSDAVPLNLRIENGGAWIPEVLQQVLIPANCGVSGHFQFQENGGHCMMCQRWDAAVGKLVEALRAIQGSGRIEALAEKDNTPMFTRWATSVAADALVAYDSASTGGKLGLLDTTEVE